MRWSGRLTGAAAATGIALIQLVGQLGSWLGPWAFGWIRQESGSNNVALFCLAAAPALSAILVLLVGHRGDRPAAGRGAGTAVVPGAIARVVR